MDLDGSASGHDLPESLQTGFVGKSVLALPLNKHLRHREAASDPSAARSPKTEHDADHVLEHVHWLK